MAIWAQGHLGSTCPSPFGLKAVLDQHIRCHLGSTYPYPFWFKVKLGIYIHGRFDSKPSWLNISLAMLVEAVLGHVGSTYL